MIRDIEIGVASRAPRLDNRPLRKRIGLIILATDHTSEVDFQRLVAGERIGVYATRIPYANPVTPENLRAMQPSLTTGAGLILPGEPLDAILYSCTSASVVIGDDEVAAAIRKAKPGVQVVTPTAAAVLGLKAFGAKRISVLTPYTRDTSRPMADYFAGLGFGIDRFTCLDMTDDREMARVAPTELVAFAREAVDPASDALFVSCTALRAAGVAAEIEQAIGKPVVTSNLATAWQCLRICGDTSSRPELGRLMTLSLPGA
jgi:maleate isomerase